MVNELGGVGSSGGIGAISQIHGPVYADICPIPAKESSNMASDGTSRGGNFYLSRVPPLEICWVLEPQDIETFLVNICNSDTEGFSLCILCTEGNILDFLHGMMMVWNNFGAIQGSLINLNSDREVVTTSSIIVTARDVVFMTFSQVDPL